MKGLNNLNSESVITLLQSSHAAKPERLAVGLRLPAKLTILEQRLARDLVSELHARQVALARQPAAAARALRHRGNLI